MVHVPTNGSGANFPAIDDLNRLIRLLERSDIDGAVNAIKQLDKLADAAQRVEDVDFSQVTTVLESAQQISIAVSNCNFDEDDAQFALKAVDNMIKINDALDPLRDSDGDLYDIDSITTDVKTVLDKVEELRA